MKDDVRDFLQMETEGGAGVAADGGAAGVVRRVASSPNWAWAAQSGSYDWMNSAGPFSFDSGSE
ncbi:hypothetical protein ACV229_09680 [Burkholderia sp. MR1-5-21]